MLAKQRRGQLVLVLGHAGSMKNINRTVNGCGDQTWFAGKSTLLFDDFSAFSFAVHGIYGLTENAEKRLKILI